MAMPLSFDTVRSILTTKGPLGSLNLMQKPVPYTSILLMVIVLFAGGMVFAQGPTIMLYQGGSLSWTNDNTNALFSLEWAPNLNSSWREWDSYSQSSITGTAMTIDVPMFYRMAFNTNISKFVPPDGQVLMIVGQDTNTIDEYVASNHIVHGGVMLYTSIQNAEGLTSPFSGGGGTQYGDYLVNTYTHSVLQIGLYMVGALDGILAGTYDSNIDVIGSWIQGTDRPVYLRIGYEFDADWTAYDPDKYIASYQRIADRMRSNGVDNVAFVWHSQAVPVRTNRMAWYPGDGYVDWVAASVFGSPTGSNRTNLTAVAELARELQKPFMIAEASPHGVTATNGVNSWTAWYDPTFEFIQEYGVRAFSYINCNWDAPEMWQFNTLGWGDARVQMDSDVQTLWLHKMTNSVFLHADTNLFTALGY